VTSEWLHAAILASRDLGDIFHPERSDTPGEILIEALINFEKWRDRFECNSMSTKLKRTPLFGQDGHLGIPIIANNNKHKLVQKSPLIAMEVGAPVPAKPPAYHREPVLPVAAVKKVPPPPAKNPASNNNRGNKNVENKNVNFNSSGEDEKKREKYLTAKYGAHQMALIRKRLKVEMWIFDQLQELYETETEFPNDVDIDLDEILDIEDENQRKKFIRGILNESKSSKEIINKFIDDLLERAKTL